MEKFLAIKGNRKVLITALLASLFALMLDHGGIASQDYKELMLALIAVFYGSNVVENKVKSGEPPVPKFDPKKIP